MANMCNSLENILHLLFHIMVHVQCKKQLIPEFNIAHQNCITHEKWLSAKRDENCFSAGAREGSPNINNFAVSRSPPLQYCNNIRKPLDPTLKQCNSIHTIKMYLFFKYIFISRSFRKYSFE